MPTFHPAFDVATAKWFVDQFEAPSLRALRKLLPRRSKIIGYFPQGFKDIPAWPKEQTRVAVPYQLRPPQFVNPQAPRAPVAKCHEQVLDLWAKGLLTNQIANECGVKKGVVSGIVTRARKHGDPRAAKRMPASMRLRVAIHNLNAGT